MRKIRTDELRSFCVKALESVGVCAADAETTADVQSTNTVILCLRANLKNALNPTVFYWEPWAEINGMTYPGTCVRKKGFFAFVQEWVFTATTALQKYGRSFRMRRL